MAWIESRYRIVKGKKTKEKLYFVCDRRDGKVVSRPAGPIYETAKAMKRDAENEKARPTVQVTSTSAKVAYDEYEILIKKSKATGTWTTYSWGLKKLLEFLSDERPVGSVGKQDMIKFRARIMQAHSINGMLGIMRSARAFFAYCVECGYILINPASGATKGIKEEEVATFLTDDQIRHILDCVDNPDHVVIKKNHAESQDEFKDIIKTVLLTGLREGGVASFRVENIFLDDKRFMIREKGGKTRVIPTNSKLVPILKKYMKPGREYVFQGWNEKRIKGQWNRLYKRAKRTNPSMPPRCRFHDLRHTFASNYLRGGGTLADLKEILGHTNIKTTIRYVHFQKSDLLDKMEKVKSDFLDTLPEEFRKIK